MIAGPLFVALFAVVAEEPISVTVTPSEDHLQVGDVLTLEVGVSAHVDGAIDLDVPQVEGLNEVSRSKSESTQISFNGMNQRITKEYTISIELEAQKAGRITIPPITAKVGSHKAESAPVTIDVGGSAAPQDAHAAEAGKIELPEQSEKNLFVRYVIDKASAYVGEEINLDLYVFANPQLNFGVEESTAPPTLDGFWREVLDQPQRLTRSSQVIGGRQYSVYRMWRIALFPLEHGSKTIPQATITFAVNRSIFGGGERARRRTLPIKIEVKPLPTEGRPSSFVAGNVGAYALAASVDHDKVPAGKAIVLTIALSGKGNVKAAKLPEVPAIPGFRVFQPTIADEPKIDALGVSGTKKADVLLMPETGGRLEIPAFELPIFDPEKGRYERLATPSLRVVVEGDPALIAQAAKAAGAAAATADPAAETAEKEQRLTKDSLRPLRYRSTLESHPLAPWSSPLFASMFAVPPLVFGIALLWERIRARARRETTHTRRRRAAHEARGRLKKASEAWSAGEAAKAYGEFHEALIHFVLEQGGLNLRGMTVDEARHALSAKGAKSELVERIAHELDDADYARFAAGAMDRSRLDGALERWEQILSELEAWEAKEVGDPI